MAGPGEPLLCLLCNLKMQPMVKNGVAIHHCYGCGGHWFDGGGLTELMGQRGLNFSDTTLDSKLEAPQKCRFCEGFSSPGADVCEACERPLWYRCPVDASTLYIINEEGVELDFCPSCRGLWFDRKELKELEQRYEVRASGGHRAIPRSGTHAVRCDVCGEPDAGGGGTDIRGTFRCGPCMREYLRPSDPRAEAIRRDYYSHWRDKNESERRASPRRGGLLASLLGSLLQP
jgi:Zn-finger nucleic acid-binding protein